MFLKLCLISGLCSYCIVLIKESLVPAFNKWTNKVVEKYDYPNNQVATPNNGISLSYNGTIGHVNFRFGEEQHTSVIVKAEVRFFVLDSLSFNTLLQ